MNNKFSLCCWKFTFKLNFENPQWKKIQNKKRNHENHKDRRNMENKDT